MKNTTPCYNAIAVPFIARNLFVTMHKDTELFCNVKKHTHTFMHKDTDLCNAKNEYPYLLLHCFE